MMRKFVCIIWPILFTFISSKIVNNDTKKFKICMVFSIHSYHYVHEYGALNLHIEFHVDNVFHYCHAHDKFCSCHFMGNVLAICEISTQVFKL